MAVVVIYTKPPYVRAPEEDFILKEVDVDAIIVPVFQGGDKKPIIEGAVSDIDDETGGLFREAAEIDGFSASVGETLTVYWKWTRIIYVGAGPRDSGKLLDNIRNSIAKAVKPLTEKAKTLGLVLDHMPDDNARNEAAIAAGLAAYSFDYFKSEKRAKLRTIIAKGVDYKLVNAVLEGVYLARDIANAPPNDLYPARLAETLKKVFSDFRNVTIEVFDYDRLVKEGFGGIVNVGKGSVHKPRLIVLKYNGDTDGDRIALVGKTVVFDTGGINLKRSDGLFSMRSDKAGGAAVVGALYIIARLGVKANVTVLLPAVINAIDGGSYLPSDVIKMWDGKTVEVGNTDAEGRLVLADAIAYASKELKARIVIDAATLTGAIVVALGPVYAGLFTRSDRLASIIQEASQATGEKLWLMPMPDEYKAYLRRKSPLADIGNVPNVRAAGAIYGALFLEEFTHGAEWAHLDIAGPGIGGEADDVAPSYWPGSLAPGYGARLLAEVVRRLSSR